MRARAVAAPVIALGLAATLGLGSRATVAAPPVDDYLTIHEVLRSPRCVNCHPVGDAPLQGDFGQAHQMDITRRSPEVGLPCTACHREQNGTTPGSPPGVPHWRMPPRETPMVFQGRTPAELCRQIKDPAQNGGKTLPELAAHLGSDPLVLWGWSPGPGRTVPPVPQPELAAAAVRWAAAGGPCPE